MTYETGTADDLEDLYSKLDTFAVTTHGGWTRGYASNPDTTNGWFELHKGSLSFSSKYPVGETPQHISVHQASAFLNSSTAPGEHTGDSGNGYNATSTGHTNANLLTERCVRAIGNGPFPSYHFLADDASEDYVHCVVEATPGMFRHFGFGILSRIGDGWTGGEYAFGHYMDNSVSSTALDVNHQTLLDGLGGGADELRCATVRIGSGLLNVGSAEWGVCVADATLANDTGGNPRRQIHGTYRVGMEPRGFGNPVGNFSSGAVSMYSIGAWYRDPNNPRVQLLGYVPDVRGVNVRNFESGQEVTVGTDVWIMFPMSIRTTAAVAYRSQFSGIAYRKVT